MPRAGLLFVPATAGRSRQRMRPTELHRCLTRRVHDSPSTEAEHFFASAIWPLNRLNLPAKMLKVLLTPRGHSPAGSLSEPSDVSQPFLDCSPFRSCCFWQRV